MRALLAAIVLAAAASVAAAEDVLVTAEDGGTFLVSPDGTWQPVIVGIGDDGQTYLLLDDGTWTMRGGAAAGIDGAFRDAVEAAVLRYEPDLGDAERDRVMDCVMGAFEPLSDEDKQALIDVDIDPDREMQERLETSYPGLEQDLEVCF